MKLYAQSLEECQEARRLAVAALDICNDLGTQVAELRRLRLQQDNRPMKAELGARIRREGLKGNANGVAANWYFRVENHGAAEARRIRLLVDGKLVHQHPAIFTPPQEIGALAAEDYYEYPLAVPQLPEQRRPLNVCITWDDDSRANRIDEFILNAE